MNKNDKGLKKQDWRDLIDIVEMEMDLNEQEGDWQGVDRKKFLVALMKEEEKKSESREV